MLGNRIRLTRPERAFIQGHGIAESCIADMRHRADWASCSDELRAAGAVFASGFRICDLGHRLTSGRGRCIQCHPAGIGFALRHTRPGWIYIAVAEDGGLTKIGTAADVEGRLRQLNAHRLAGVRRWHEIQADWCQRPAALEAELHRRLADHRFDARYERKADQVSREVFACPPVYAINTLAQIYLERPDW